MNLLSRNQPLGFAERTRKNLVALEAAAIEGKDVHLVTQVATSLLGLVAYLQEKKVSAAVERHTLEELATLGWPKWNISLGTCTTLGELAKHLRNSIAHGRLSFSSESRVLAEVAVEFEDCKWDATKPYWRASLRGDQLRDFCMRFITLVNEGVHPGML
jgi:hypothetical protein